VRPFHSLGVHVGQQMVDVARDSIRVVGLVRVAMAEHVDRVAPEALRVAGDVPDERLQVTGCAVQKDHVLALAGSQGPCADPVRVDVAELEALLGEVVPERHGATSGTMSSATSMIM